MWISLCYQKLCSLTVRVSGFQSFGDVLGTVKVLGKAGRKHGQLLPAFSPHPSPSSSGPVVPASAAAPRVLCLLSLLNISKARRGFVIFLLTPGKGGTPQDCDLDQSLEQES